MQYYFDPVRPRRPPIRGLGIMQYGPFSKDTFPKRTLTILIVVLDSAQVARSFEKGSLLWLDNVRRANNARGLHMALNGRFQRADFKVPVNGPSAYSRSTFGKL